jgi:hypothetical protein
MRYITFSVQRGGERSASRYLPPLRVEGAACDPGEVT